MPPISDDPLWRYMDFPKLVDLLQTRSLFFSRLENMEDPLEGHHPRAYYETMSNVEVTYHGSPPPPDFQAFLLNKDKLMVPIHKRYTCINCWHQNKSESDAMWNLYSRDGKGIAIKSSAKRLRASFLNEDQHKVSLGKVHYTDYKNPHTGHFIPMAGLQKDSSYQHENEVRAIIWSKDVDGRTLEEMKTMKISKGHHIEVKLESLIEELYLSPHADEFHKEIIKKLLQKYDLKVSLKASDYRTVPMDFLPLQ
jgi:hypothetical protein